MVTKYNKKNKFTKKQKQKHNKKGRGSQNNDVINNYEKAKIRTDTILKQAIDDRKKLQKQLEKYKKITVQKKSRRQSKRLLQRPKLPNYKE
jgi:ribosomal protein L5